MGKHKEGNTMATKKELSASVLADRAAYTPMIRQYLSFKDQYPDALIFYRIGDFYEMFFQDALVASRELEIVLTGKDAGVSERVPMCGVPFHALDVYLDKLTSHGFKVVIIEQIEDPSLATGLVKRDVVRIVTPGTILSGSSLDARTNNYLSALAAGKTSLSLAYADLSTGEVFLVNFPKDQEILKAEVLKIGTHELLVPDDFPRSLDLSFLTSAGILRSREETKDLPSYLAHEIAGLEAEDATAVTMLLNYLVDTQKKALLNLQPVERVMPASYLRMDYQTRRNLELVQGIRSSGGSNTLASVLDHCATAMGSRALRKAIGLPFRDPEKIKARADAVEILKKNYAQEESLRKLLANVYDLERLIGKIAYETANPHDLLQLEKSLSVIPPLKKLLVSLSLASSFPLDKDYAVYLAVYQSIASAIAPDAPLSLKDGNVIKAGHDPEIDRLRSLGSASREYLLALEAAEREKTGIKTLRVGYTRAFGYYIEVSKGQIPQVKEEFGYIRKQTLTTGERYITLALKEREAEILGSQDALARREAEVFAQVRSSLQEHIPCLERLAKMLAELDLTSSLARAASLHHYVRPLFHQGHAIAIKGARHPMMELYREDYIPNDVTLDDPTRILLITGPNMSGKSTYMRMIALLIVMAQMGSFVPAASASLPLFDAIYTRIGASDDIVAGDSTFMVEMKDVEFALANATADSFLCFDEIGRGTATCDGLALAQAIIEHLDAKVGADTVFSTHYHELTQLEASVPSLLNVHVGAEEQKGSIVFLHKVLPGPAYQSYGIEVARLAHLPLSLLIRAQDLLAKLESERQNDGTALSRANYQAPMVYDSKSPAESAVIKELKEKDPDDLSPREALSLVTSLHERLTK